MPRRKQNIVTAEDVLAALEAAPDGKATTKELGITATEASKLAELGLVVKLNETRKTSAGRGRPSYLWAKADNATVERASEVDANMPTTRSTKVISIDRISSAITELRANHNYDNCSCVLKQEPTFEELRHMPGCKTNWICGALVALRSKVL